MDTISVLTLRLAEAIGVYLAAVGIGGLIRRDRWSTIIAEFERSPALTFVTGGVVFAIGAAIPACRRFTIRWRRSSPSLPRRS